MLQLYFNTLTTGFLTEQDTRINVMDVPFKLVGIHDTPRILTECQEDLRRGN